ncbi:MAG: zinc ribbon domain-containing protein, partial [Cyanobacteria bacterium P01_A01_bin.83]
MRSSLKIGQKLEYKMAKVGRQVHYRPPHYSSKTSSVNGVIGKRNGHWFQCTSGAKINSDFNAAKNLALWDYRSCPVDFQKPQRGSPQSLAKQDDGRTQSVPVF